MTVDNTRMQRGQEHSATPDETQMQHVQELRAAIADTDQEIVALIARRLELVRTLGVAKARRGLPIADPAREAAVLRAVTASARAAGIDEERVREMFWCVIDACRSVQLREQRT
jgi:chorismate mutase